MTDKYRKHQREEKRLALLSFIDTLSNVLCKQVEEHKQQIENLEETKGKLAAIRSSVKTDRNVLKAMLEFAAISLKHRCIDSYFYCAEGFLRRNLTKLLNQHGNPHLHGSVLKPIRRRQHEKRY